MPEELRAGTAQRDRGSNADADEAIACQPTLEAFLNRKEGEQATLEDGHAQLARILSSQESQSELQSDQSEGAES